MISISNVNIGKKIALALGGNVLLLAGLSALALFGSYKNERLAQDSVDRLMRSKLAKTIAGDTADIGQNVATMIFQKSAGEEAMNQILAVSKSRAEAMEQYKKSAATPEAIQEAAEMAELVQVAEAINEIVTASVRAGQYSEAVESFTGSTSAINSLRVKAGEASALQDRMIAANEQKRKQTSTTIWIVLIAGCLLAAVMAIFGGVVLIRGIATPLAAAVALLGDIARGDLSRNAPAAFQARGDEIGTLTRTMQTMIVALRKMIQDISGDIQCLSSSSTELMNSSVQMTSGSRDASDKAHTVSAAAAEMSSSIASVAEGMEQATTNLANVSSATEQMASTIGEIAENSEKARQITEEAARQAERITVQIDELGEAARAIGKVTESITEISSQTNLLALNATIEAARAGAAGKGFAVVATEIKALARQTAGATEDIKTRIAGVQSATAKGITEIGKVSQVLHTVGDIVASIAAAIEQQSATTKDTARNIAEASLRVTHANSRVSESSQASREIASDIVTVDQAALEMASGSDHVRISAGDLSAVAESLRTIIGRFHTDNPVEASAGGGDTVTGTSGDSFASAPSFV